MSSFYLFLFVCLVLANTVNLAKFNCCLNKDQQPKKKAPKGTGGLKVAGFKVSRLAKMLQAWLRALQETRLEVIAQDVVCYLI